MKIKEPYTSIFGVLIILVMFGVCITGLIYSYKPVNSVPMTIDNSNTIEAAGYLHWIQTY